MSQRGDAPGRSGAGNGRGCDVCVEPSSSCSALRSPGLPSLEFSTNTTLPLGCAGSQPTTGGGSTAAGVLAFLVGMGLVAFWEVDLTSHRWDQNLVIDPVELSRGETVRARLKHEIPDCRPGSLEVGLVCREFYDTRVDAYGREGSPLAQRMTIDAVAYEEWQAGHDRSRPYSFTVPVDAPYSYEGECLSFAWAVTTRYRTGDDLPVERIRPLWVRP
jgi:hypothetical protein